MTASNGRDDARIALGAGVPSSPLGVLGEGASTASLTASVSAPRWVPELGLEAVLERWRTRAAVAECVAAQRTLPATSACYTALPPGLDARLVQALAERGITRLYRHQRDAVERARAGEHVLTATPTASGKSLCLHLPVLDALARNPAASALYLYPTKALSRDQEHGIHRLIRDAGLNVPALVYDGDTPGDARRAAKKQCRVLLTNPDMLHAGILPNHARWANLFANLAYVVIDELHVYRGVFGSHMAHVMARLKRIAEVHGSAPRFILATATIGNPREHAARLVGVVPEQIHVISESSAPSGEREVLIYNPPIVNAELGIRASALKHAVGLTVELLEARVPSIVFGQSRTAVEVMLKYIRERARDVPADAVFAYRGGYLPEKRRAIERGLRNGEIRCVVATSALELGIDIGDLAAVICVGYPGSVAATWQRFGRAGRRNKKSLAVLVCSSRATDQYMASEPDYVLAAKSEEARIDPENAEILIQHLKCAAFEYPFTALGESSLGSTGMPEPAEPGYFGMGKSLTVEALDYLTREGLLYKDVDRYAWIGEGSPASHTSLRSVGWDNFVIVDIAHDRTLAELDWHSAHTMLHEQAIYQHDAGQYQVERLDYENHKAFVRPVDADYFTTALTHSQVSILDPMASQSLGASDRSAGEIGHGEIGHGDIKVVESVTGYKKIKFFTHENAGYGDVFLPDIELNTTGFWWTPELGGARAQSASRALWVDALRGAGSAMKTAASVAFMCEPEDLGQSLGPADGASAGSGNPRASAGGDAGAGRGELYRPTLFLFDALPGGVGLARRIYERAGELMARAANLIAACRCQNGCPACIGPCIGDVGGAKPLRKRLAIELLGG
jgi:DEAD/DEAH box helicase domain-containing protein